MNEVMKSSHAKTCLHALAGFTPNFRPRNNNIQIMDITTNSLFGQRICDWQKCRKNLEKWLIGKVYVPSLLFGMKTDKAGLQTVLACYGSDEVC